MNRVICCCSRSSRIQWGTRLAPDSAFKTKPIRRIQEMGSSVHLGNSKIVFRQMFKPFVLILIWRLIQIWVLSVISMACDDLIHSFVLKIFMIWLFDLEKTQRFRVQTWLHWAAFSRKVKVRTGTCLHHESTLSVRSAWVSTEGGQLVPKLVPFVILNVGIPVNWAAILSPHNPGPPPTLLRFTQCCLIPLRVDWRRVGFLYNS